MASRGAAAKAAKSTMGTASSLVLRRGLGTEDVSASSVMVAPSTFHGKQSGGPEEQHGCHEDIDEHRRNGAAGLAGCRRIKNEPQQVGRKGASHRVDEPNQECSEEGATDGSDPADDDHHEGKDQD